MKEITALSEKFLNNLKSINEGLRSLIDLKPHSVLDTKMWKETARIDSKNFTNKHGRSDEEIYEHTKSGYHAEFSVIEQIENSKRVDHKLGYDILVHDCIRIEVKTTFRWSQKYHGISGYTTNNIRKDKADYLLLFENKLLYNSISISIPLLLTKPKIFMKKLKYGRFEVSSFEGQSYIYDFV